MPLEERITMVFEDAIANLTKDEKKHSSSLVLRTDTGFVFRYPLKKALENHDEFLKIIISLLESANIKQDNTITIENEQTPNPSALDVYNYVVASEYIGRLRTNPNENESDEPEESATAAAVDSSPSPFKRSPAFYRRKHQEKYKPKDSSTRADSEQEEQEEQTLTLN